jgi:hypothetical protein
MLFGFINVETLLLLSLLLSWRLLLTYSLLHLVKVSCLLGRHVLLLGHLTACSWLLHHHSHIRVDPMPLLEVSRHALHRHCLVVYSRVHHLLLIRWLEVLSWWHVLKLLLPHHHWVLHAMLGRLHHHLAVLLRINRIPLFKLSIHVCRLVSCSWHHWPLTRKRVDRLAFLQLLNFLIAIFVW